MGTFVKVTVYGTAETGYVNLDRVERLKWTLPENATLIQMAGRDTQFLVKETPEDLLGLGNPPAAPEKDPRKQPLEDLAWRVSVYDRHVCKRFRHYKSGTDYRLVSVVVNEADGELMVVYEPWNILARAPMFVRPVLEFFGEIGVPGGRVRRFDPVPEGEFHGTV